MGSRWIWIEGQKVAFIGEDGNKYSLLPDKAVYFQVIADDADLPFGNGLMFFTVPPLLNGMNLVDADIMVTTPSTLGFVNIQIRNVTKNQDMLSTPMRIDENEFNSYTASIQPVIDDTKDDVATADVLRVDVDFTGTGTLGLHVVLTFRLP